MDKTILNTEHQIAAFVGSDNKNECTVHFDYEDVSDQHSTSQWTVTAHTYNPTTEETFLLNSQSAPTKDKALKKIFDNLKKQKGESPFSVTWMKRGDKPVKPNVSHFYCHDVLDVVEKFFHGKNPEDYIVYEIKLNAIS